MVSFYRNVVDKTLLIDGDPLKSRAPSYRSNAGNGRSNYPGMVKVASNWETTQRTSCEGEAFNDHRKLYRREALNNTRIKPSGRPLSIKASRVGASALKWRAPYQHAAGEDMICSAMKVAAFARHGAGVEVASHPEQKA